MDKAEEKESDDAFKQYGRSARNRADEGQKDAMTTHKVCDDFNGKKNSNQKATCQVKNGFCFVSLFLAPNT